MRYPKQTMGDEMTGLRIRSARLAADLRLADLAEAIGVSASLLSRIETGRRRPTRTLLAAVAPLLAVDVEDLAGPRVSPEMTATANTRMRWPEVRRVDEVPHHAAGSFRVADAALAAAMHRAEAELSSLSPTERYRACVALATLASRPLDALRAVRDTDEDPLVRQATQQLLATLTEV